MVLLAKVEDHSKDGLLVSQGHAYNQPDLPLN
jgi:hypothetical protein